MKTLIHKFLSVSLGLLLATNSFTSFLVLDVKAVETATEMVLEIDGSALATGSYSIDSIDRFNTNGIAIIADSTTTEGETKYGLMNSSGVVKLAPIYDEIIPFDTNNNFYLVTQYVVNGENIEQNQGLYSQTDGSEVLEIKYAYIPNIDNNNIIQLSYKMIIDNQEVWKSEVKKYDSTNVSFSDIGKPSSITLSEYDYIFLENISDNYSIVHVGINNSQSYSTNEAWLVDVNGDLIGFTEPYNSIQYVKSENHDYVVLLQQDSSSMDSGASTQSGLFELSVDETDTVVVNAVIDFDKYDYVFYDNFNGYFEVVSYTGTTTIIGRLDPETQEFITGYDPTGVFSYEFTSYLDSSLTELRSCTYTSGNLDCSSYLYNSSDSSKTNLFGEGNSYSSIYSNRDGFITLQNGQDTTTTSNLLFKSNGSYVKLLTSDVTGNLNIDSTGWVNIMEYLGNDSYNNPQYQNYYFDLSNVTTTQSLEDLSASDACLTDNGSVFQAYGRYKVVYEQIDDSNALSSLYDKETSSFILNDVYNLIVNEPMNDTISGTYQTLVDSAYVSYGFTYNTDSGLKVFNDIVYITEFNESGYATITTTDSNYGLINTSGSGNYVLNPSGITAIYDHFDYDGVRNLVITYNSDSTYDYIHLNDSTLTSIVDLTQATKYGSEPALIKTTNTFAFVDGITKNEAILTDAAAVSSYTNGIALKLDTNGAVTAYDTSYISLGVITDANDIEGNLVYFADNSIKFYYLDSSSQLAYHELPSSITSQTITSWSQENFNLYKYTTSSGDGYMYYDATNNVLNDLGINISPSFSDEYFTYVNTSNDKEGILNVNGLMWVEDSSSTTYSFGVSEGVIYQSTSNTSTIIDSNGNYTFVDDSDNPVYFDSIYQSGILVNYQLSGVNGFALVTDTTVLDYPGTFGNNVDGSTTLIEVRSNDYSKAGLIKKDGTVLFDIYNSNPYQQFEINLEYNFILPYYQDWTNEGIYDLNGNIISDLSTYIASGQSIENGQLEVKQETNFMISFNGGESYEDLYLRNVYDFNTSSFKYENNYLDTNTRDGFSFVNALGELSTDVLWEQQPGPYRLMVKGGSDTNVYAVDFTYGVNDLAGNEILPTGYFNNLNIVKGYFEASMNMSQNWGLFDLEGNPVACASLDPVELTCGNISFNENTNQFDLMITGENSDGMIANVFDIFDISTGAYIPVGNSGYNSSDLVKDGVVVVGIFGNYLDSDTSNDNIDSSSFSNRKFGILNLDGTYMLEPEYDLIDNFDGDGNAVFNQDASFGLVNKSDGIVLDMIYTSITSTKQTSLTSLTPSFDERGLIRINNNQYTGLADKNGELFDGAAYQYAYYLDGDFYLKKFDENWMIISDSAITDTQMHGSVWTTFLSDNTSNIETFSLDVDLDISSLSRVSTTDNEYFIASYSVYDTVFNTMYDYYGILNSDGSVYLDFDYSNISLNTTNDTWNLEIYNSTYGTYQVGVMDEDKNFIVSFNNKYDSVSEYTDGFAIGTSGTAPDTSTSYNPFMKLLMSTFFLDVNAAEDEFALEILDENGNVVGDLSDDYESAILLGNNKALVQKDGQYYIATLSEQPYTGELITSIAINESSLNMEVDDTSKLYADVFPLESTQPRTITWESSDPSVVSVDGKGNIKAIDVGSATITLTVNEFIDTCEITVKTTETITDSSSSSSSSSTTTTTVTVSSQTTLPTTEQMTSITQLQDLFSANTLSTSAKKELIKESFNANENFIKYLTYEEKVSLESIVLDIYKDQITLNKEFDVEFEVSGLINILNFNDLISGKKVEYDISVSTVISEEDKTLTQSYMDEHLLNSNLIYPISISITQKNGNGETVLSNTGELEFTLSLPSEFVGIGQLEVLRVHDGEVDILPVTLNDNYTFSFVSDKFSTFTLVKKEMKARVDEPDESEASTITTATSSNNFIWYLGLGLIVSIVAYFTYRFKFNRL